MPETTIMLSGLFADCLADYAKKIERTSMRDRVVERQALAQFVDAPDNTVYHWLNGSRAVTGERQLRAMYFFEAQRYEVFELRALPEVVWQTGWLIANRKIGLAAVLAKTGYSIGHFLRLFREGAANMHAAKKEALVQLVAVFETVVPSRSQTVLTDPDELEFLTRDSINPSGKIRPRPKMPAMSRDVEILSHLIQAALPLAERLNSDECTDADRQLLRQLTKEGWQDGARLFRLANALNGLCSQKAHQLQQNKKG